MRILALTNLYPPAFLGGYELLCQQVTEQLRRRHEVLVLTSDHPGDPTASTAEEKGVLRELRLYLPFDKPGRIARLRRVSVGLRNEVITRSVLRRFRPDVVLFWSQLRLTTGPMRAALATGTPRVTTLNDDSLASYCGGPWGWHPRRMLGALLDRSLLRRSTLADLPLEHPTAISCAVRKHLVELGLNVGEARVLRQGIPIERFPMKPSPGEIRSPMRLLYVGQLAPGKGLLTLLDGLEELMRRRGRGVARLAIAGSGPAYYEMPFRRAVSLRELPVEFCGKIAHRDIAQVYRRHDALVFPSNGREAFGLSNLEAMASGLPVVSTDTGGQGELVRHDDNALVFGSEDHLALADQLERLIDEPDLARGLAHRARAEVEEHYTLERYVRSLESLLEHTLSQRA